MAFPKSSDFFPFAGPQVAHQLDPFGFTMPKDRPQAPFTPAFDFFEAAHEYILEGELPGLHDKEQIMIEFTNAQTISIRGKIERKGESERIVGREGEGKGDNKVWVAERKVGEFRREFGFPGSIDVEAVKATLECGVLRIVVPKIVLAGPRRIQVQ